MRLENRDWVGAENLEAIFTCDDFLEPNSCKEDFFWRGVRNLMVYVWFQVGSMVHFRVDYRPRPQPNRSSYGDYSGVCSSILFYSHRWSLR